MGGSAEGAALDLGQAELRILGGDDDVGNAIIIDLAGNVVVSGWSWGSGGNLDLAVWRYDWNGTLDATFGTLGVVTDSTGAGGGGDEYGADLVLDVSGGLYVCGDSRNLLGDLDLVVWSLDATGAMTPSFGSGGIAAFDAPNAGVAQAGNGIVLDSLGRIIVAGWADNPPNASDMALWRIE